MTATRLGPAPETQGRGVQVPGMQGAPTVMRYGVAPGQVPPPPPYGQVPPGASYGQVPPWAPPGQVPPGPPYSQAPPRPAFAFDIARWSQGDRITAVASLVLLLSLFASWFHFTTYSQTVAPIMASGGAMTSNAGSASGLSAHAYMYLVLVLAAAVVVYFILQAGYAVFPFNLPASRERLLLAATGINLLLVLFGLFMQPDLGSEVGLTFGAYVGIFAAITACAPQAMPYIRAQANGQRG